MRINHSLHPGGILQEKGYQGLCFLTKLLPHSEQTLAVARERGNDRSEEIWVQVQQWVGGGISSPLKAGTMVVQLGDSDITPYGLTTNTQTAQQRNL